MEGGLFKCHPCSQASLDGDAFWRMWWHRGTLSSSCGPDCHHTHTFFSLILSQMLKLKGWADMYPILVLFFLFQFKTAQRSPSEYSFYFFGKLMFFCQLTGHGGGGLLAWLCSKANKSIYQHLWRSVVNALYRVCLIYTKTESEKSPSCCLLTVSWPGAVTSITTVSLNHHLFFILHSLPFSHPDENLLYVDHFKYRTSCYEWGIYTFAQIQRRKTFCPHSLCFINYRYLHLKAREQFKMLK